MNASLNTKKLEDNFFHLKKVQPQIVDQLMKTPFNESYQIRPCKQEGFFCKTPTVALNSTINSIKEKNVIVEREWNRLQNKQIIILLGVELGYIASALFPKMSPEQKLWIFEKDIHILRCAFMTHDFTNAIQSQQVIFYLPERSEGAESYFQDYSVNSSELMIHKPSYNLYPHFYGSLKKSYEYVVSMKQINNATISKFDHLWVKNILGNLKMYALFNGIDFLANSLKGKKCIVVGGGPSLTKQLIHLQKIKEAVCIICVSTSLGILLEYGITPHIVLAVDPQTKILFHFIPLIQKKNQLSRIPLLIAEPTIQPTITRQYPGTVLFTNVSILKSLIDPICQERINLDAGGSVITIAYSLAKFLNAKQIIFVGLDLAYTSHTVHFKGSELEKEWYFENQDRLHPLEKWHYQYATTQNRMPYPGFYGNPVLIDPIFQTYIQWLENRFGYYSQAFPTINCTEGGIAFQNIPNLPLTDVLQDILINPVSQNFSFLQNIQQNPFYKEALKLLQDIFQHYLQTFELLNTQIDQVLPYYEKVYRYVRQKRDISKNDFQIIDQLDQKIINQTHQNEILSLSMQKILHQIETQTKKLFNTQEEENPYLKNFKKTITIYEALKKSSENNTIIFQRFLKTYYS